MNETAPNPLLQNDPDKVAALEAERRAQVSEFVRTNPDYYADEFEKIGGSPEFLPTFNPMAGLFGPIWYGARGLWKWALVFLIVETFAFVQMSRGLFGDLSADARERIASIEGTLELRKQQLQAAIDKLRERTLKSHLRSVPLLSPMTPRGIASEAEDVAAKLRQFNAVKVTKL